MWTPRCAAVDNRGLPKMRVGHARFVQRTGDWRSCLSREMPHQHNVPDGTCQRRSPMITELTDLPSGVIGFEAGGKLRAEDYRDVIQDFDGVEPGALWQDVRMGVD